MSHSPGRRSAALLALAALLLAGCGTATGAAAPGSSSTSAAAGTSSTPAPADSPAAAGTSTDTSTAAPEGEKAGTTAEASYPVTVTADNGEVTIPAKPVAIASLSASATEMLYAIGAGDAVTVVDKFSDYPANLPSARVDAYQLNIESLAQFAPDLVVASAVTPDQQAQFDALGITAIGFQAPPDIDGMYAQIMTLGQATGHVPGAEALIAEIKAEIADITADLPPATRPLTYYYELDSTFYSVSSDTFVGHILGLAGMKSIADTAQDAAESGGYPQLDAEFILHADPDYILAADTICCDVTAATIAKRDGWSTLSAVAADRIVELDDNIASRWTPRITELLRTVVKTLKDKPVG